jgi:hypothetical protein
MSDMDEASTHRRLRKKRETLTPRPREAPTTTYEGMSLFMKEYEDRKVRADPII